jgi:hypothetical protein
LPLPLDAVPGRLLQVHECLDVLQVKMVGLLVYVVIRLSGEQLHAIPCASLQILSVLWAFKYIDGGYRVQRWELSILFIFL